MSAIEHAENMLLLAHYDIKALNGMLDTETFTDGIFGFHAQQAAEKSLKAWITALGGSYPFVHDIGELIGALKDINCPVEGLEEYIDFNPFAVQLRYSMNDLEEEPLDRKDVIAKIQELYGRVEGIINAMKNPTKGQDV